MISRSSWTPRTTTAFSLIKKDVWQLIVGACFKFVLRTVDLMYNSQPKSLNLIFIGHE